MWSPSADDQLYLADLPAHYQVTGKLGAGAIYHVYRARRTDREPNPEEVALKILSLGAHDASWEGVRFHERSERILRGLDHRGIPKLLDAFKTNGGQVLETELVEGSSLVELLANGSYRQDESGSLELLLQAAEILRYLHALRPPIVHRDVKPGNLMLTADRQLKLIDFNAATDDPRVRVVGGQTQIGTVGYVPFEQFEGRASPASDVYALGATFTHLMTGVPPHEIPRADLISELTALYLSRPVATLLAACLAVDPERRPSAEQLGARSKALLSKSASAAPIEAQSVAQPASSTASSKASGKAGKIDQLWEQARLHLEDQEQQRSFIRAAVISEAHSQAIERYNQMLAAQPDLDPLITKYKREIANQVAARILAKTATDSALVKQRRGAVTIAVRIGAVASALVVLGSIRFETNWGIIAGVCGMVSSVGAWVLSERQRKNSGA